MKTLGVTWLPDEDVFAFKANPPMNCLNLSKDTLCRTLPIVRPSWFLASFFIRTNQFCRKGSGLLDSTGTIFSRKTCLTNQRNGFNRNQAPRSPHLFSETLHTFVGTSKDAWAYNKGGRLFKRPEWLPRQELHRCPQQVYSIHRL